MFGFFKFVLYTGVLLGLVGFMLPYFRDESWFQQLPPDANRYLSFGGLGLILLGFFGRRVTDPND